MRKMLHFLRIYLPWTDIPTRMYSPRRYLPKINNIDKKLRPDEIKKKFENIQKTENNLQRILEEKEKIIENLEKLKNDVMQEILLSNTIYVGELGFLVKIFVRLKMWDMSKNKKQIYTVVEFVKMVEERSEFLSEEQIKKWQDFRQKFNQGNINVKELEHVLKVASEFEDKMTRMVTNCYKNLNQSEDFD